jgi:hypothetical protein
LFNVLQGERGTMTTNHCTEAAAAQAIIVLPEGSNRRDWEYFDERLTALRVNDVETIIERGRVLIEAKEDAMGHHAGGGIGLDAQVARRASTLAALPDRAGGNK